MAKSKFELVEPSEEDTHFFTRQYANLGEIAFKIEDLEANVPDKRTKDYQLFCKKINYLIDLYNSGAKFKAFKHYE